MSAAGRALSKALDRPEDWYLPDRFCIKHRQSGIAFWMANGSFFFDGDNLKNTPRCLGLIERHRLYFKANKIARRMRREKAEAAGARVVASLNPKST